MILRSYTKCNHPPLSPVPIACFGETPLHIDHRDVLICQYMSAFLKWGSDKAVSAEDTIHGDTCDAPRTVHSYMYDTLRW